MALKNSQNELPTLDLVDAKKAARNIGRTVGNWFGALYNLIEAAAMEKYPDLPANLAVHKYLEEINNSFEEKLKHE